jgi:hypothetical protein
MAVDAWVLREPLKVLRSEDHPYLETALATLGRHEIALNYSPSPKDELRVFLDGERIFELGDAAPGEAWFRLCQELGFDAEAHWDLDPALILFQQVLPRMARGWHEAPLPYGENEAPEGVISLAKLKGVWSDALDALRQRTHGDPLADLAISCFERLPLRAVVFHDDHRKRTDYMGNGLDEPFLGVFLRLGASPARRVTVAKATLMGAGGLKWSPWRSGGDWREDGRDFLATRGPEFFLRASGLGEHPPTGFRDAFDHALAFLTRALDPVVEAYRNAYPAPIPWHRDAQARFLNHSIVQSRIEGGQTVLTLDDGTELVVSEHREPVPVNAPGRQSFDVWGV